ncbi:MULTISPECIES: helix-turn-helix domain-containing protein [Streptomyces]|jgi:transcriptional regulator with XRE-family HTH domain|uniref:helix-turn-helix domain-containing protein n=1 Tax=Streptomyces TaxID=1883 RepID=UPI001905484D|nr:MULTISPECIES: helix-turn-helix transcriptional regulator [unclassified Streptomyces]MCU4745254.1 helix-turn-helix domain-containing protein [Streptomyces sp. G-5]QQN79806.1 helix-turn-helix domain-containing protein [Streptomyces sp. XC 2026]
MVRVKLPPTIRQRRLGGELRRLRERADLSATNAGKLFGTTQSRISNIEAGGYAVSADRVRALARLYDCTDEPLIDALAAMTGGRTRGWWEEYREILSSGALDLAEVEHHARAVRVASVIHIPGLLQTTDHARAVVGDVVPPLAPYQVEHRVSHRIKRQAILYGDHPTPFVAIIHEAALRMGFGGPKVARAQLKNLIERSEEPHIQVRIIPFGSGTFPSAGHGIDQFSGPLAQLDTIQLDSDHGSVFLDAQSQLDKYRTVLDRMESCALPPAESRDLIHRVEKSL